MEQRYPGYYYLPDGSIDPYWIQYEEEQRLRDKCEYCFSLKKWSQMQDLSQTDQKMILKLYQSHDPETHQPIVKKHHTGNGIPQGIFAGTLTMSPNDPYNEGEMIHAIEKIMKQKSQPVKRYAWYLEYTDAGTPHIHFIYETESGGRIHKQTFKRNWRIWDESISVGKGHRGGYHRHCHDEEAYLTYIAKCNNINSVNRWTS